MNLFVAGLRQTKATLSIDKADLSSLPASKNLLLAAQKQLLELPLIYDNKSVSLSIYKGLCNFVKGTTNLDKKGDELCVRDW